MHLISFALAPTEMTALPPPVEHGRGRRHRASKRQSPRRRRVRRACGGALAGRGGRHEVIARSRHRPADPIVRRGHLIEEIVHYKDLGGRIDLDAPNAVDVQVLCGRESERERRAKRASESVRRGDASPSQCKKRDARRVLVMMQRPNARTLSSVRSNVCKFSVIRNR